MSDQNNERNVSIPRGYKQEDTDARKESYTIGGFG